MSDYQLSVLRNVSWIIASLQPKSMGSTVGCGWRTYCMQYLMWINSKSIGFTRGRMSKSRTHSPDNTAVNNMMIDVQETRKKALNCIEFVKYLSIMMTSLMLWWNPFVIMFQTNFPMETSILSIWQRNPSRLVKTKPSRNLEGFFGCSQTWIIVSLSGHSVLLTLMVLYLLRNSMRRSKKKNRAVRR